jgi:parallel beta-helix repeat protein
VSANDLFVLGNVIGGFVPNDLGGINVRGARRAVIQDNTISENGGHGIAVSGLATSDNFILENTISGNSGSGIALSSTRDNFVQANSITANQTGVASSESARNRIRRNSIFASVGEGIIGTIAPAPPLLSEAALDHAKGTACAGCTVEVFSGNDDEGRWFEGEAIAGNDGSFSIRPLGGFFRGALISATATTEAGDTSGFSIPMQIPPPPPRRRVAGH